MKRVLLFLFAAVCAANRLWAYHYDFQSGDLCYNIISNVEPYEVEVTFLSNFGYNYSGLTTITIPTSVVYNGTTYTVTRIGEQAFYRCTGLTSITIPESVISIGGEAFSSCTGLTSITIPESVTSIGGSAFNDCTGLTSITIPESVISIGGAAFSRCTGLTSITIPESVTRIGEQAFYRCTGLTSITIPESVTSIGGAAFSRCTGLTSITIPESVTSIGDSAFNGCTGLTSITIPNSVTSIGMGVLHNTVWYDSQPDGIVYFNKWLYAYKGDMPSNTSIVIEDGTTRILGGAFKDCTGLTSITIPESVTSIGSSAFSGCTGLTSITIPESVTSIGSSAFSGCTGFTSITIPESVTSIGGSAFPDCSELIVESGNSVYDSRNHCNAIIETATNTLIAGCKNTIIPNGVTSIGKEAFYGCMGLTSITIPNSVTSIGQYAFYGCTGLTSITIPNSVTSIGQYAFYGCTGLTSITIPNSVTGIEEFTFYGCTGLTSVTIPNSVTNIENRAFQSCTGLTSITIPESVTSIEDGAFRHTGLTSITIPNSVTSIGRRAFSHCDGLASVTIGNNITSIGERAFEYCDGLTSVTIPNSVTNIENRAFQSCTGLTSITIPESVTSIEDGAFRHTGLTSITIPNSVTSIGASVFSGCTGLTSVTIGNSVTSIGRLAFDLCTGLTSVTIGNSVTSIASSAFVGCTGLTSIVWNAKKCTDLNSGWNSGGVFRLATTFTFGEEVEYIPAYLCFGMSKLTSITIPNSVTSIGKDAFYDVPNIAYYGTATGSPWGAKSVNGYVEGYLVYESAAKTRLLACSTAATGEIIIPESVTSIGDYAFDDCMSLTSITIPNSVTSIGKNAFYDVPNIAYHGTATGSPWGAKSVNGYVEGYLVYESAAKTRLLACSTAATGEIIIPESVTSIGDHAFDDCMSLTSITIPNSVTSIGDYAFAECYGLTKTNYTGDIAGWCNIDFGNGYSNPIFCSHNLYINGIEVKDLVIPDGVTTIKNYAFERCKGLTSVTIGNSVTSIGVDAFNYCYNLTSVTWNAKHCGDSYMDASNNKSTSPFYDIASRITSFRFGNEVEYIPAYLCYGMNKLTSVTIPESVANIGDSVFYACTGLTSVTWNAKHCGDSYMDASNNKSTSPFYDIASQITSFTFGNRVEYIPAYLCYGMAGISSITILNNATGIGEYAFANLGKLTELHLGTKLESIGANAFAGCRRLYNIYCYAALPPLAEETSFANYNSRVCVPCDVLPNYKYDAVWGNFRNIDCIGSEEVNVPTNSVTVIPTTNDATFTWPSNGNANAYTLVITKDGVVFCTLTFNANGQLTGIAFAPSKDRNNAHAPQAALATANGWQFTVTGLNEKSDYAYTLTVTDKSDKVLKSYEGTFTTTSSLPATKYVISVDCNAAQGTVIGGGTYDDGTIITLTATPLDGYIFSCWSDGNTDNPRSVTVTADAAYTALFEEEQTALDQVCADGTAVQKIVREGQVLILRGGKLYTLTGQEVVNN